MNTKFHMKRITAISGFALIGLLFATSVNADNPQSVAVEVTFVAVITITGVSPLQFGLLDDAMILGEEVIIAPDDGLTDLNFNVVVVGPQFAADMTITATTGASINILIDNAAPGTTDYTLTAFRCEYDVIAEQNCDGTGMNVTAVASGALRVGVTLTSDVASITAGNQDGSFDVTVTYQ